MSTIGLFDSGVGGLSVLLRLWQEMPGFDYKYFADTVHMPYGPRSAENIEEIVSGICHFLIAQGCSSIVMACNTSSAIALAKMRSRFDIPIIGVLEPGARAAAKVTRNGKIGIMATEGTVRSGAYTRAIQWLGAKLESFSQPCPRLAPLVESGNLYGPDVTAALEDYLHSLLAAGVDTIILGCTHYPFLARAISEMLPSGVSLVDPAQETALEVKALLGAAPPHGRGKTQFFVSGSVEDFQQVSSELIGLYPVAQKVFFRRQGAGLAVELE